MKVIVDNDVLLKGACYSLLPTLIATVPGKGRIGILASSRFVVPKQITKTALKSGSEKATAEFDLFLAKNEELEPTPVEEELAALFEASAQRLALNLDTGESQALAMIISRAVPWFVTGDKRAIIAADRLLDVETRLQPVTGKIRCLERLLVDILAGGHSETVRSAICGEPKVDKALTICFACNSPAARTEAILEGLNSYLRDLAKHAARVMSK